MLSALVSQACNLWVNVSSEALSVFEIFKIGVGPSSSHTLGPWKASLMFVESLSEENLLEQVVQVQVDLYGSLAKTGKGHGTDLAILMGLSGQNPSRCRSGMLPAVLEEVKASGNLKLGGLCDVAFAVESDLLFHREEALPFHPNGMTIRAKTKSHSFQKTYYSIGGGFVVQEGAQATSDPIMLPFPIQSGVQLEDDCRREVISLPQLVRQNEAAFRSEEETDRRLDELIQVMMRCVYDGCHTGGLLPGGLLVKRRAKELSRKLIHSEPDPPIEQWFDRVAESCTEFDLVLQWVTCFALAVNEENAAYGRVVTAPTNGAAGVIPAVLLYCFCFTECNKKSHLHDFLLTAAVIGMLFKKHATISAAMGGCQAEIGVSSAMAAAGLACAKGGSVGQILMAAEIGMEHHLGLTCDPIGGLVQVPCIERNTMGAMKAITAAQIALGSDPASAKVSLDDVIQTMWETAQDMSVKYKETSEGGLALKIPLSLPEC